MKSIGPTNWDCLDFDFELNDWLNVKLFTEKHEPVKRDCLILGLHFLESFFIIVCVWKIVENSFE